MQLGRIGISTDDLDAQPATTAREAASTLEEHGFGTLWIPENTRREAFANSTLLLSATRRLIVATGIVSIYARDAMTMANGQRTLAEAFPGRFLLGLGVSHVPSVEGVRGHRYGRPVATMSAYLDAMDRAPFDSVRPPEEPPRVLAALGPGMLRLAARRSWGAHPANVPVEHTRRAREVLGTGPLLAVEQAFVLARDPGPARQIARANTSRILALENYVSNLRRLGYEEADLAGGGSDRLVDAVVAWGGMADIERRVREHFDAGADHVCLRALTADTTVLPLEEWRAAATLL